MAEVAAPSASFLEEARAEDVMSRGVLGCALETPLTAVAEMMARHRVHCVVGFGDVSEGDMRVWSVVSDLDLVAVAAAAGLDGRTAGDSAATEVVTVRPDESLRRVAQLMNEHGVAHLLVTDPTSDRPVGVVSTLDVARVLAGGIEERVDRGAMRVDQLMTTHVISVPPDMPLKEVAALLAKRRISGVPVVRDGEVLGVVSEEDFLLKERGAAAVVVEGMVVGSWVTEVKHRAENWEPGRRARP